MTKPPPPTAHPADEALPLADRPGFLIRRLHQIHVALFHEECGPFGLTPVQYSVLTALLREGVLDQVSIAHEVGIDRANTADVVARLEANGLIRRGSDEADRRVRRCELTEHGRALTLKMRPRVERAQRRTLEALPPLARREFARSLSRLVAANNSLGRTRLKLR